MRTGCLTPGSAASAAADLGEPDGLAQQLGHRQLTGLQHRQRPSHRGGRVVVGAAQGDLVVVQRPGREATSLPAGHPPCISTSPPGRASGRAARQASGDPRPPPPGRPPPPRAAPRAARGRRRRRAAPRGWPRRRTARRAAPRPGGGRPGGRGARAAPGGRRAAPLQAAAEHEHRRRPPRPRRGPPRGRRTRAAPPRPPSSGAARRAVGGRCGRRSRAGTRSRSANAPVR